jgi:hypothetical protein
MSDVDCGHWVLKEGLKFLPDAFAFVYRIEHNIPGGKFYIGKKQMVSKRKLKPLKGKNRKRIQIKESDWRSYMGSSNDLLDYIKLHGKDQFTFTIIFFASCKWEASWEELKEQLKHNVLENDLSFNSICHIRLGKIPKGVLEARKLRETK